jgi:hypothetical protein
MKRKLLIALFSIGTVVGFGSGIFSMAHCHHHGRDRRAAFERHVADVCVEAAYRARDGDRQPPEGHRHGPHHP